MKVFQLLSMVAVMFSGWITSHAQVAQAEVPGDHFSLEGALELFKKSASPEEFEKMLNSPDSKVNNLDLNGDGYIDYVRVLDRYEGDVHAFILQAVISERETQDVAVIELEKLSNGKAVLQIVGDEDVYGVTTIIEPTREVRTYAGTRSTPTVVNVWAWPSVQYVYGPRYSVWVSPWTWHYRPVWYRPWRPVTYVHYYSIWRPYRPYYAVCHTHRVVYAREIYRPHRRTSVVVVNRHREQLTRYRDDYRNGRTRDDGRRSYVNNPRSTVSDAGDRRREQSRTRSRTAETREALTRTNRSTSGERSSSSVPRSAEVRRAESPRQSGASPARSSSSRDNRDVLREATRPSHENRTRTLESTTQRRSPVISNERTAPTAVDQRRSTVERRQTPQVRQQTTRPPAVQRSSPERRPAVQQRSVPREHTVRTPSSGGSSRQPSMNTNRSSQRSTIQRQSPTRSSTPARSSETRRARQ